MNSSISSSDPAGAYERLHPENPTMDPGSGLERAATRSGPGHGRILGADKDVLISASTAAGKTEAAFLPVLTLVADRAQAGLSVLYVSPLKALINDQFAASTCFANRWNPRSCAGTGTLRNRRRRG